MAPDADAVRRWAVAHAATMATPGAALETAVSLPVATPGPAVLSSFAQVDEIDTGFWTNAVAWATHPDGRLLLAAAGAHDTPTGTTAIWDYGTRSPVRTLTWTNDRPGALQAVMTDITWGQGPAGQLLLAALSDGRARIWDPDSGELVHVIEMGAPDTGNWSRGSVAWGRQPDGRFLLAGSSSGNAAAWVWDPGTRQPARRLPGYSGDVRTAVWVQRQDGRLALALGEASGTVQICDPDTGLALQTLTGHRDSVDAMAWAQCADGRQLLATISGEARVWDTAGGQFTELVTMSSTQLTGTAWGRTGDGRLLLAVAGRQELQLWDCHGTPQHLHTQQLRYRTGGNRHLDWTVAPSGQLLLAAGSRDRKVQIWEAVLDPPVQPPATRPLERVTAGGQAAVRVERRGKILDPPEDVTPEFQGGEGPADVISVRCAVRSDGHVLVAARSSENSLRVWDATTGTLLHVLNENNIRRHGFDWGHMPDGRLRLATASTPSTIELWDPGTGHLAGSLSATTEEAMVGLVWVRDGDGRPLLATRGIPAQTVTFWDPETGGRVRSLIASGVGRYYETVIAEGWLADGRHRLVTGGWSAPVRVWDPDTGAMILQLTRSAYLADEEIGAAAWGTGADGHPELAIGSGDGRIQILDPETGSHLRSLTGHESGVWDVVRVDEPGWPPVLVSAGADRTVRIWDPHTGAELARLPGHGRNSYAIDIARVPDDGLLLVVATGGSGSPGPARVYRIATGDTAAAGHGPDGAVNLTTHRADELAGWLLRLGHGGLWPPLGLVADLVTLTGSATSGSVHSPGDGQSPDGTRRSATALSAPRLAVLADAPGITRLRRLGWASPARVAFAALLTSDIDIPRRYIPPDAASTSGMSSEAVDEADPMTLRKTLIHALTGGAGNGGAEMSWQVPVANLHTAAAGINDQVIALLAILGPDACASDPLLPLRLAHHIPQLPALSPRELRALTAAGVRPANSSSIAAGTTAWSPGTAGVARTGPLTRLLPTQLALPRDLLAMRLAENQLLYRQHRAPAPPAPEPVTVILDTTPPTFGPAGNALRLAAHLITVTLWDHGQYPALVTLADPDAVTELRSPADLIRIWASATLDHPSAALTAARQTAAGTGQPSVLCTHFQTARDCGYLPGPDSRLLTTHQPPEKPHADPVSPWHAHLPPSPAQARLTAAIGRLLMAPLPQRS